MLYGHSFQQYLPPLKTQPLHSGLSKSFSFLTVEVFLDKVQEKV